MWITFSVYPQGYQYSYQHFNLHNATCNAKGSGNSSCDRHDELDNQLPSFFFVNCTHKKINFKISLKGFALKDCVLKNLKDFVLKIKRLCLKRLRLKEFKRLRLKD